MADLIRCIHRLFYLPLLMSAKFGAYQSFDDLQLKKKNKTKSTKTTPKQNEIPKYFKQVKITFIYPPGIPNAVCI